MSPPAQTDGDPLALAEAAAHAGMSYPFAVWHFGDSVYVDGLVELARVSGARAAEYAAFAYGLVKAWIAHTRFEALDHTAPGAAIVALWERTGDRHLLDAAVELARLWDRFPRAATAEAYLHTAASHRNVAIDCAHFDGPYFARLAAATGDERYAERAVYELLWRLRLLQEDAGGLCQHAFDSGRGRLTGMRWGRGQGWALLGMVETLRALPTTADGRAEILGRLDRLAGALVACQAADGHWHTIVDDDATYLESSVAAFFVAAVAPAIDAGLLDGGRYGEALERAWDAVRAAARTDGVLDGVSAETPTWLSPAEYRAVPTGGVFPWGQGPLVLAALTRVAA